MSFFDKMKAKAGVGTAQLEVDIIQRPMAPGDTLKALVRVTGGKTEQKMNYLRYSLEHYGRWYLHNADGGTNIVDGKIRTAFGNWQGADEVTLAPGQTVEYMMEFQIPSDVPGTGKTSHPILGEFECKHKLYVRADIAGVKDPEYDTHFNINRPQ